MNKYLERIESLRALMRARSWDAVVVRGSDPHQSEYPCQRYKRVEWLSGFTGEAADMLVTLDHAGLWTDSRYFIQALQQLEGSGVQLHKTRVPGAQSIEQWIAQNLDSDSVVAIDSLCNSAAQAAELERECSVCPVPDLLSLLWEDRPMLPQTPFFCIESGESRESKIDWLRSQMDGHNCSWMLVSALDQIAWLLNVRASDIEYNPLLISYLLVGMDEVRFYALKQEIEDEDSRLCIAELQAQGIDVLPYTLVELDLAGISQERVWVDPETLNAELYKHLSCPLYEAPCPIEARKAIKNGFELRSMEQCHIQDGLAMERFLYWIETSLAEGRSISEWEASVKLDQLRAQASDYLYESFETISAYGADAALPHFVTPRQNSALLQSEGLYLCDSGGQYLSGTTDITRTVPLGPCTRERAEDYTLVLKAHINLALAVFPSGTPGCRVDAAARLPLWKTLRDFGHGTGHGVGFFLGVHEGPAQIRQNLSPAPLLAGMVFSNEPALYREGSHGIRHENLMVVEEAGENEFGHFLRFRELTLCHFDTSILDASLLTKEEIDWLNSYNNRVFRTLGPLLDERTAAWLEVKTAPICLE